MGNHPVPTFRHHARTRRLFYLRLCEACNLDGDKHVDGGTKGVGLLPGNEVGSDGWYDKLNPAGKEVMSRCFFTVFKECLADGLGENTFCETVVSESAKLGWTEAEDLEHEKVVETYLDDFPVASVLAYRVKVCPDHLI